MITCARYESPIGTIRLAFSRDGLCALGFERGWPDLRRLVEQRFGPDSLQKARIPRTLSRALDGYFAGNHRALEAIEVDLGGTPFQRRVWRGLREIPAGATVSYRELAHRVQCPNGARAVGAANAANPVSLVVPCHRVIRADGELCGYAGGRERKAWLLRHEGAFTSAAAV